MYKFILFILNFFIIKALASQIHPSLQHYVHVTSAPTSPNASPPKYHTSRPVQAASPTYAPGPSVPTPSLFGPNTPNAPSLKQATAKALSPSKLSPATTKSSKKEPLDSNVLNNLAIALQLLIVSNILNVPHDGTSELSGNLVLPGLESLSNVELPMPYAQPVPAQFVLEQAPHYTYEPQGYLESVNQYYTVNENVPGANFLSTSSFSEPNIFRPLSSAPKPSPRSNMALMSPYEVLASDSPYSDPFTASSYGSYSSKKNIQSPYASIMSDSDLFSMADFY